MELVDAGVPFSTLAPIKRTIIEVEGVMVRYIFKATIPILIYARKEITGRFKNS